MIDPLPAVITESGASYRRYYHAAMQPELLLAGATLPRSLAFQLEKLGASLDRLPESTPSPELRAPLRSLRTRVAGWSPRELLQPASTNGPGATALLDETSGAIASLRELAGALEGGAPLSRRDHVPALRELPAGELGAADASRQHRLHPALAANPRL